MTHLLKMLAMPLAFVVAIVLFASPSAPGAFGMGVGGVAYASDEPPCETSSWCMPPPPVPPGPPPEPEPEQEEERAPVQP